MGDTTRGTRVIKGALKLKGGLGLKLKGVVDQKDRKKKKKAKKKRKRTSDTPTGSGTKDKRTAAERAYDKVAEERELKKLKKLVTVTHREKINQYNSYLASLSEHHDVPKVGNAGMG